MNKSGLEKQSDSPKVQCQPRGSGHVISRLFFSKISYAMIQKNGIPTRKTINVTIIGDLNQDTSI